jgi:threonine aldolase
MNFTSDNAYGAAPEILQALTHANTGAADSYGGDDLTAKLRGRLSEIFQHELAVFPVVTGTAANALSLATLVPPHGAILCHTEAHIAIDECGAPEFFTHGAKLVEVEGSDGKLSTESIACALDRFQTGAVHHSQPTAISITQASERGTCYGLKELEAIAALARSRELKLHMDGARLANAIAYLGCSPADATWRAGVDVLSFGATKNGALCADAVIFFDPEDVRDFEYRRKKSGHLVSKMRFLSAQLLSYLDQDRWLSWAKRANQLATQLAIALEAVADVEIAHPVESNAVFARVPNQMARRLRAAGAQFLDWEPAGENLTLVRLVCSSATPEDDIVRFVGHARE